MVTEPKDGGRLLTVDDLERGRCYGSASILFHDGLIRIESIGPDWVRWRAWDHDIGHWRNPYEWTGVRRQPRSLLDTYGPNWYEVEDPSE